MVRVPTALANMVPSQLRRRVSNVRIVKDKQCITFKHHSFDSKYMKISSYRPEREVRQIHVIHAAFYTVTRSLGRDGFRVRRPRLPRFWGFVDAEVLEILVCRPAVVLVVKWGPNGTAPEELVFIA